jgi:hypothetical protein
MTTRTRTHAALTALDRRGGRAVTDTVQQHRRSVSAAHTWIDTLHPWAAHRAERHPHHRRALRTTRCGQQR